jgi:hypothetical protein
MLTNHTTWKQHNALCLQLCDARAEANENVDKLQEQVTTLVVKSK